MNKVQIVDKLPSGPGFKPFNNWTWLIDCDRIVTLFDIALDVVLIWFPGGSLFDTAGPMILL